LETENIAAIRRSDQYGLDVQYLVRFFVAPSETKVLDYGCSGGGYLDSMPQNWRKFGYEVNPTYLEYLPKNKPHIHVYKSLSEIDELFNLITMRGVIEHIQQHDNVIELISKRLVDGGGLFISATPDFSSVCACLYKEKWNQILCPAHIHQFTISSLALLMARAGLVLRHLSHPYSETPYALWEKDSKAFLSNSAEKHDHCFPSGTQHAFPGNMMTAFFEKVALR
jgi:2-polyprenyl-3-methyl-5-hydroxy-6-metoxy-1,4-benzoquinol methylase